MIKRDLTLFFKFKRDLTRFCFCF